jgi:hypothetical protein
MAQTWYDQIMKRISILRSCFSIISDVEAEAIFEALINFNSLDHEQQVDESTIEIVREFEKKARDALNALSS